MIDKRIRVKKYIAILKRSEILTFVKNGLSEVKMDNSVFIEYFISLIESENNFLSEVKISMTNKFQLEMKYVDDFINKLLDFRIIEFYDDNNLNEVNDRYSRQLMFLDSLEPQEDFENLINFQNRFNSKHILMLGVGGIGNYASISFVASGIKKITLIDGDLIEISNLNRQIAFSELDIGNYKVDVAKKFLNNLNSKCEIKCYNSNVNSSEELSEIVEELGDVDFLFLSADSPLSIYGIVDKVCSKYKIPYLRAGYIGCVGYIGPIYDSENENEMFEEKSIEEIYNYEQLNKDIWNSSSSMNNAIISNIGVIETIKYLSKISKSDLVGKSIVFNLKTYDIELI